MSDPIEELRRLVQSDTQAAVAARLNVSAVYISDILAGRRNPGKKVLDALGFERQVTYRKVVKKSK